MDLLPTVFTLTIPTIWVMLGGFVGVAFLLPVLGVATQAGQRAEATAGKVAKAAAALVRKAVTKGVG